MRLIYQQGFDSPYLFTNEDETDLFKTAQEAFADVQCMADHYQRSMLLEVNINPHNLPLDK